MTERGEPGGETAERGGTADEQPPLRPPARPGFEFRTPPSAIPLTRPGAVTASAVLWLAAAVALLVAVLLPAVAFDDFHAVLTDTVAQEAPNESPATQDRVVALTAGVLIGGGLLIALLLLGAAAALHSGRGGARIGLALLLVPLGLYVLVMLGIATPVGAGCLAVSAVLAPVATVLMFLPVAGTWFERRRLI